MANSLNSKERLSLLVKWGCVLLLAGLAYAVLCARTGWTIPCLFYEVTGWYCPGCGVTRMCLSLLRGDFSAAYHANRAIFITIPLIAVLLGGGVWRWVKGQSAASRWENILAWGLVAWFLLFGILRNLPAFAWLAPMG